ncbi:hypothetical protein CTAYLR_005391 [Chrysophaeum taylorii]|uniref:DUF4116 domain-containing protein n=1 Tax=Chrysophaeum taylorii TaxID=2483200 RepID=A0AAD7U9T1_9STRA|nr:hypothetical protein CTAYLR_005391 [Chrysophaeum taylorii]
MVDSMAAARCIVCMSYFVTPLDIVTDVNQLVFFGVQGWWFLMGTSLVIILASWRSVIVFAAVRPKIASFKVGFALFAPGLLLPCWNLVAAPSEDQSNQDVEHGHDASDGSKLVAGGTPSEENVDEFSNFYFYAHDGAGASTDSSSSSSSSGNDFSLSSLVCENVYDFLAINARAYADSRWLLRRAVLVVRLELVVVLMMIPLSPYLMIAGSIALARERLSYESDDDDDDHHQQHHQGSSKKNGRLDRIVMIVLVKGFLESLPQLVLQTATFSWVVSSSSRGASVEKSCGGVPYFVLFVVSSSSSATGVLEAIWNYFFGRPQRRRRGSSRRLNKRTMLDALREGRSTFGDDVASDEFKGDKEVVLAAVQQQGGDAFMHAAPELKSDKNFVLSVVRVDGDALMHAATEMKRDREIVLAAIGQRGEALEYAANELKGDKEIVLSAVERNGWMLVHAATEMKRDREVVLAAVKRNGLLALEHAAPDLKKNKEFILACVGLNGLALEYAAEELKKDCGFVLAAARQDCDAFMYAADEVRNDKNTVLAVVEHNGKALEHASDELRGDRDVVLAAVRRDGSALEYAGANLKNDKEIVLAAVRDEGKNLEFAARGLREDKEIVLAAVRQNGRALQYASEDLKKDKSCVLAAVGQYGPAVYFAADDLKKDDEVLLLLGAAAAAAPKTPLPKTTNCRDVTSIKTF